MRTLIAASIALTALLASGYWGMREYQAEQRLNRVKDTCIAYLSATASMYQALGQASMAVNTSDRTIPDRSDLERVRRGIEQLESERRMNCGFLMP